MSLTFRCCDVRIKARSELQYIGNVSDNAFVTLVVTSGRSVSSTVSESAKITVINGNATNALNYEALAPGYGSTNYMCGLGSYYGASVSGTWNP